MREEPHGGEGDGGGTGRKGLGPVTRAPRWPVRTKVSPEGHSLAAKGKPGGDGKFMAESLRER